MPIISGAISGFFKNLFGGNLAYIFITIMIILSAILIVPNFSKVAGLLGYQTRSVLKEKLQTAEINTHIAIDTNKLLNGTINVLENTVKNTEEAIVTKVENDKKTEKVIKTIVTKKKEKIEEVVKIIDPSVDKEKEISNIQISAIWDTYCEFNEDASCKVNQS